MAQRYGFFNSVNNDRIYDASDVARFLKKFFTNGVFNNTLQVMANDNMTVSVSTGQANIEGYSYENDEELVLDIADADSTLPRIDSIIVRLDLNNRQITSQILQGSYASTPSQPTIIRTGSVYDLRLANVSVPAGATRITTDMITDTRFTSDCGNVVGAVQQIDTDDVFQQYETMFNNWFSELQVELDGNVAANLENQIVNLESKTDRTDANIGNLSNLNTTDKSSIVGAINEVHDGVTDSGWIDISVSNGASPRDNTDRFKPAVRKIGNTVYMKGQININAHSANINIATVPEGFAPIYEASIPNTTSGIWVEPNSGIITAKADNTARSNQPLNVSWLID